MIVLPNLRLKGDRMLSLSELEKTITALSPADLQKFSQWFWQFENERWDIKIETDVSENKLSSLAEEALTDYKNGKATEL